MLARPVLAIHGRLLAAAGPGVRNHSSSTAPSQEQPMPIRPYIVKHRGTGDIRLVEAVSQAQAISHVASTTYTAEAAGASDIVEHAVRRGIKVERAGAAQDQLDLPGIPPALGKEQSPGPEPWPEPELSPPAAQTPEAQG